MVLGAVVGTYVSRRMWGSGVPRPTYGRALAIVGGTVVFTALGIVFFRIYWSRPFFLVASLVWAFGTLAHRAVRRRRPWTETMIVISGEKSLADDLRTSPHANVQHVYDPGGEPPSEQPMPGTTVVVDLRSILSEQMAQFVSSCNIAGYRIRALIDVYEEHTGRLALIHLAEGWEISEPLSRSSGYAPFKRSGDFLLALVTAPLWLPLGALIWVAVRLDSRGPAIFKQRRTGYRGSAFTLYKFRTMYDETRDEGPRFAHPEDDRVTRVGKVLRRFRVDEIPQMWNVLKGDLSLVGPRPEQQEFVARFNESIPFYGYRHLVRPGLTGWAQVSYGYADDEADTIEKLTYDLYYVKHMSPWFDARVIGQSIWTVVSGFGAQ
jgi:lipopolysaccharide/colanic/teichoic acid biosynthesis glycosyltransferase